MHLRKKHVKLIQKTDFLSLIIDSQENLSCRCFHTKGISKLSSFRIKEESIVFVKLQFPQAGGFFNFQIAVPMI